MKPPDKKSLTEQALSNGKGVTWLDDCRIPCKDENGKWIGDGRFTANLLVSDDVLDDGKNHKSGKMTPTKHKRTGTGHDGYQGNVYGKWNQKDLPLNETYGDEGSYSRFFDLDAWTVKNLPFLIVPKAGKKEKNAGLEDLPQKITKTMNNGIGARRHNETEPSAYNPNNHPTVKPLKLMAYLITMGSRENDVVLDAFCGSGTACVAAKLLNRQYIGIEKCKEYHEIAVRRINSVEPIKRKPASQVSELQTLGRADKANGHENTEQNDGKIVVLKPPADKTMKKAA